MILLVLPVVPPNAIHQEALKDQECYFFSYGGYMDQELVQKDLKYAPENMGVYKLDGYEFYYNRAPNKTSAVKATGGNIMQEEGKSVYGVLWKVKPEHFTILDAEEQVPELYQRYALKVINVKNPQISKIAQVYIATTKYISEKCYPRHYYVSLVLKAARQNDLPPDYIKSRLLWTGP